MQRTRGYFEIGIYHTKTEMNVGTLLRSAHQLGAAGIFTIGRRYKQMASDTTHAARHIPVRHYETFDEFKVNRPVGATLIGVEMGGIPLSSFAHPESCVYLLGAEDHGLPPEVVAYCNRIVSLESVGPLSYNVAVAGSIVMCHRMFCSL